MGYYTRYTLHTNAAPEVLAKILTAPTEYGQLSDPLQGEEVKWYKHEDDMLAISKKFPLVTFMLEGEGGDNMDCWRKWFKGGKKIGEVKAVMPPDPIETVLTEVDYSELAALAELKAAKEAYEMAKERLKGAKRA